MYGWRAYPEGAGGIIPSTGITNADVATAAAIAASKVAPPTGQWASVAPPAFGAGGARTPSATRDVDVMATVRIIADKGENGGIEVYIDTILQGNVLLEHLDADAINASSDTVDWILRFTVPANKAYYLGTVTNSGTPAFSWTDLQERTL